MSANAASARITGGNRGVRLNRRHDGENYRTDERSNTSTSEGTALYIFGTKIRGRGGLSGNLICTQRTHIVSAREANGTKSAREANGTKSVRKANGTKSVRKATFEVTQASE
jgi:hypothetical protein